ncbi:MAG: hypothetical protein E6J91_51360 [Deltaproteobacteria bacterium]|nr:MAG: hypothetical protein E6J91_51360 [Deltaproteobacteria bacterium]
MSGGIAMAMRPSSSMALASADVGAVPANVRSIVALNVGAVTGGDTATISGSPGWTRRGTAGSEVVADAGATIVSACARNGSSIVQFAEPSEISTR